MWNVIFSNIAAAVAIGGAAFLAYSGTDGWGWFLFVAVLIAG